MASTNRSIFSFLPTHFQLKKAAHLGSDRIVIILTMSYWAGCLKSFWIKILIWQPVENQNSLWDRRKCCVWARRRRLLQILQIFAKHCTGKKHPTVLCLTDIWVSVWNWIYILILMLLFFILFAYRQPKHLLDFLLAELGTSGSMDGNQQLIIKGRFQSKQIENVLRR